MASDEDWGLLEIFFRRMCLPNYILTHDSVSKRLLKLTSTKHLLITFLYIAFAYTHDVLTIWLTWNARQDAGSTAGTKTLSVIFAVLFFGIGLLCLPCIHAMLFYGHRLYDFLNSSYKFHRILQSKRYSVQRYLNHSEGIFTNSDSICLNSAMINRNERSLLRKKSSVWFIKCVMASAVIPCLLVWTVTFVGLDPIKFLLPSHLNHVLILKIVHVLLRLVLFTFAGYIGWLTLAIIFIVVIVTVQSISVAMQYLLLRTRRLRNISRHVNFRARLGMFMEIQRLIRIHRQIRILIISGNDTFYYLFPILLLSGMLILIASNYGTIKMHDTIVMPFYLVMPMLSFFVVVIIFALFPKASSMHEESSEFLRRTVQIVMRDKETIRVLKSERRLRWCVGPLFYAKRSTKSNYFFCCIDYTVNALLLL
jgi:hypothetical protein